MNKILIVLLLVVMSAWTAQGASSLLARHKASSLQTSNAIEWRVLIDGFLEGVGAERLVANSTDCVHNIEFAGDDMIAAVEHFVRRGWTWENYLEFNGALGSFTPVIRVCYDVSLESWATSISHFSRFDGIIDFANQAAQNAATNVFKWYDVGTAIMTAIQTGRQRDLALHIGEALDLLVNFPPRMSASKATPSTVALPDLRPIEEFVRGFLNGTQIFASKRITNCINSTDFVVQSVEDANNQFNKHTEEGFRQGIFELADILEVLRPLNEECAYAVTDIQNILARYIKIFDSPIDIAFNAAKHFNQIFASGSSFLHNWTRARWEDAGMDLGEIFFYIFFDD